MTLKDLNGMDFNDWPEQIQEMLFDDMENNGGTGDAEGFLFNYKDEIEKVLKEINKAQKKQDDLVKSEKKLADAAKSTADAKSEAVKYDEILKKNNEELIKQFKTALDYYRQLSLEEKKLQKKENERKSKEKDQDKTKELEEKKLKDSRINKITSPIKLPSEIAKLTNNKNIRNISSTAASFLKLSSLLGKNVPVSAGAASVGISALIDSIKLISQYTIEASKNSASFARSIKELGINLDDVGETALSNEKNIKSLKNRWNNIKQYMGEALGGVEEKFTGFLDDLLKLTGVPDTERKDKLGGIQADISNRARQSGFSLDSSRALAGGTYSAALGLSEKYPDSEIQASDIAKKLADAWLTGSAAAKEYGVVVNDQVLAGYLWNLKNIDIANVQITDAQKQRYRYELMMEELGAESSDAMQDLIRKWTQLGFIIDKTKGKLFSFDEVINITAADSKIPEVVGGLYSIQDAGGSGSSGGDSGSGLPIVAPSLPTESPMPFPATNPVTVPVTVTGKEQVDVLQRSLEKVYAYAAVPVTVPVSVGNAINGLNTVLEKLTSIYSYAGRNLGFNIAPSGLQILQQAEALLERVRQLAGYSQPAAKTVTVPTDATSKTYSGNLSYAGTKSPSTVTVPTGATGKTYAGNLSYLQNSVQQPVRGFNIQDKKTSLFDKLSYTASSTLGGIKDFFTASNIKKQNETFPARKSWEDSFMEKSLPKGMDKDTVKNIIDANKYFGLSSKILIGGVAAGMANKLFPSTRGIGGSALSGASSLGFADGGIGTREMTANLFENNKKEAVIPLESQSGIDYLSKAMEQANNNSGAAGGDITINLSLSGVNVADNNETWERVGRKIAEVIDVQRQRRGELTYGGSF